MIARVAAWNPFPDAPWVTEVGCSVPGVLGLYHLVDDSDGNGLSISFAENEQCFTAATEAILSENARRGPAGFNGSPTEVTTYRVHAHTTRR
jgi:hypothetical protein